MSKKQPNRLAKLIDHQAFSGSALPKTLADDMLLYTQATKEVKMLLVDCLPEEILHNCWVVGLSSEQLTLSVSSVTAANHIRYLQDAYLQVLNKNSVTFKQLKQIRIIVSNVLSDSKANYSLSREGLPSQKSQSKQRQANSNQALSQNTKQTIAQAAKHVTTDKNLQKALLKLIEE